MTRQACSPIRIVCPNTLFWAEVITFKDLAYLALVGMLLRHLYLQVVLIRINEC